MQWNTKHKFECSKGQGLGRMANGMPIKINLTICLKNETGWIWNQIENNVDLTHIKNKLKDYCSQRLWDLGENIESEMGCQIEIAIIQGFG